MTQPTPHVERSHLELLYHISRELSSRLELRELIERILRLTSESVGAETGSLILVNENGYVYDAALIVNGAMVRDAAAQLGPQLEHGLAGWALRQRQMALVLDTSTDTRWQRGSGTRDTSSKSALAAPLIYADRALGVLTLVYPKPNHFTEGDLDLITAIVEQAAVSVENARLLRESRRQTQAMRDLVETAHLLSSSLDANKLLRLLLGQALKVLRLEEASIALMDYDKKEMVIQVSAGAAADKRIGLRLELGRGIAGWVAQTGQAVIVPDVKADPRYHDGVDQKTGFLTRAVLCAPIQFEGYTIGVIEGLNPAAGSLDRNTLPLLTGIASLAGNAIAHAQQYTFTQAAKDRYAGLFEDSYDPIIITDLDGKITDVNNKAAVTLGYTRAELIGLPIKAVHRVATGLLGRSHLHDAARGIEMTFEARATTKSGRDIPVEVRAKRISTPDYDFIQWIERDISERVRMEEMRNDLTAMIIHDLRAPLGNVMSSLTLLQSSTPADDEATQSVLAIATRAGLHLARLVDSLLDMRRLEAGQAELNKTDASISTLILEAAEQVRPLASGKGITVQFDMPSLLPPVRVDADMIKRVIINLLENAVKYTPGSGQITASAKLENNSILISVTDTGSGIPEAERSRIFDKFARVQRIGAPKGLGLGLAFCKLAVEAHGGRIWADAPPAGQGSTLHFTLPLAA